MTIRRTLALISALTFSFVSAASAVPIPVTNNPAQDLIFNFNFTSSVPYASTRSTFRLDTLDAGELVSVDYFNGPGGTDGISVGATFGGPRPPSFDFFVGAGSPGINDGTFSVGFRLSNGAANLTNFTESVVDASGVVISSVTVVPAAVPEPATLALLGIGVAGVVASRRRNLQ